MSMLATATASKLEFGEQGELRQAVGDSGRVHLDRWLPYLVLHRSQTDGPSLARRIAVNSPAYLIWSPDDDAAAWAVVAEIGRASCRERVYLAV